MKLQFNLKLADNYKSNSQIARVLSENWVYENSYCPSCGNPKLISHHRNNPVADFFCPNCKSNYELKSFKSMPKFRIVDGAYNTMIDKVINNENPHFFFLQYSSSFSVLNYFSVPKYFFTYDLIEKRKPLSTKARRAKWVGCNILFGNLPQTGIIYLVKDSTIIQPESVLYQWQRTSFLRNKKLESRGWLVELISILEKMPSEIFTIQDVYKFEELLRQKYPENKFIKAKIRQQLQVLRDKKIIKFLGKGKYQKGA